MNWPTEGHNGDRPPLCASTIQYLAAHGFIDPTHDPGLAVRTALQDLHADDEQDELTGDDNDDDVNEQLAAQLIEPKGPNPQQQMFSEKPTGPTTLLEESKALIAMPLPAASMLDEGD